MEWFKYCGLIDCELIITNLTVPFGLATGTMGAAHSENYNQQFLLCVLLVLCFVELKFVNKKNKGVLTLNEPTTYPLQVVL